jgi:hypothetical protein
MYTTYNFKSKKELKDALARGVRIGVFQPGPFGSDDPINGTVALEGPHYPAPHRWYASAVVENSVVVKIKS